MNCRPMWPPGAEIAAQAFEKFSAWEERWSEDLVDIEITDRATIYGYMMNGIDIDSAKIMVAVDARHQQSEPNYKGGSISSHLDALRNQQSTRESE